MATSGQSCVEYTHKVLTIKCCIESASLTKKEEKIRNPSVNDWDKNLQHLLSKIVKKFKFLSSMDESAWSIQINNTIINKENAQQLKKILQTIPPIPIIQIVETANSAQIDPSQSSDDEDKPYVITVHFGDKQQDFKLSGNKNDWNENKYREFQKKISIKFNLHTEFELYEDIGGDHVNIDDMDDIFDAFEDAEDQLTENTKSLHLFVEVENKFKIECDGNYFEWIPRITTLDDEKQWEANYNMLLNEIHKEYNINTNEILIQLKTEICGNVQHADLMETWQELVKNDNIHEQIIKVNFILISNPCDMTQLQAESDCSELTCTDNDYDEEIKCDNIASQLVLLGSDISTMSVEQRKYCHNTLKNILSSCHNTLVDHEMKSDDHMIDIQPSDTLQALLDYVSTKHSCSDRFIACILSFLRIIGYDAHHDNDKGFTYKGLPNISLLNQISQKLYHLSNAMQKPNENIYQQLKIKIPQSSIVVSHQSGINDNKYITFQLLQIVIENQQASLIDKVTLNPEHLERFINFLVPNASKYKCKVS